MEIGAEFSRAKIVLEAAPGGALWRCRQKAARLALEQMVQVEFIHNDRRFIADPAVLVNAVAEKED